MPITQLQIYQLPDAPPPPKLPPPPLNEPLSLLELLLQPPLLLLECPLDQRPLLPDDAELVMASLNIVNNETTPPAIAAKISEPMKYQARNATTPPAAAEPINRPSSARMA
jgi:hypothetical protein